ncbi:hemerythrin domain-containing protein [Planotetraspora sp. A-T 1434]|uniref:hemerythrin domain-containing protein n=1 Tax=Planotetraspora sp. A-T 1434 TaxID=2979219 RepID=UPI0021C250D8|nr:hemerythrin domain-containing protein [Planotetraspora sp. A-T 1434]MCT9928947.1 hemerythrin domain-containing protein [Planotetraspora sp. A-T 1434]
MDRETTPGVTKEHDVIELLIRQHVQIRELFDEVDRGQGDQRREAFSRLVRLLAVHETAEEEIVHPYARRKLVGGDTIVDNRLHEEEEAKEMLARLDDMDVTTPEFSQELERLRAAVFAHAAAEERYEFSELKAATTEGERRAMAVGVKAAEAMAPTHPHPGTESAAKNLLLGPPIAIMDRARDVIRKAMGKKESGEG